MVDRSLEINADFLEPKNRKEDLENHELLDDFLDTRNDPERAREVLAEVSRESALRQRNVTEPANGDCGVSPEFLKLITNPSMRSALIFGQFPEFNETLKTKIHNLTDDEKLREELWDVTNREIRSVIWHGIETMVGGGAYTNFCQGSGAGSDNPKLQSDTYIIIHEMVAALYERAQLEELSIKVHGLANKEKINKATS